MQPFPPVDVTKCYEVDFNALVRPKAEAETQRCVEEVCQSEHQAFVAAKNETPLVHLPRGGRNCAQTTRGRTKRKLFKEDMERKAIAAENESKEAARELAQQIGNENLSHAALGDAVDIFIRFHDLPQPTNDSQRELPLPPSNFDPSLVTSQSFQSPSPAVPKVPTFTPIDIRGTAGEPLPFSQQNVPNDSCIATSTLDATPQEGQGESLTTEQGNTDISDGVHNTTRQLEYSQLSLLPDTMDINVRE